MPANLAGLSRDTKIKEKIFWNWKTGNELLKNILKIQNLGVQPFEGFISISMFNILYFNIFLINQSKASRMTNRNKIWTAAAACERVTRIGQNFRRYPHLILLPTDDSFVGDGIFIM